MRKVVCVATTVGAALILVGLAAGPSLADPPAGTTPVASDIVGVGTDTGSDLMNGIAAAWNASGIGGGTHVYSWDAWAPAGVTDICDGHTGWIRTKTTAPCFTRPSNVVSSTIALRSDPTATVVDFAGASSVPDSNDRRSVSYVAFAGDAVTVAQTGTAFGASAPSAYTLADLNFIYSCSGTGPLGAPRFNELPSHLSTSTEVIKPYLPWTGSDTRRYFLTEINGGIALTPGACVIANLMENDGTQSVLFQRDVVYPYSVGTALGQVQRPDLYPDSGVGILQFPKLGTTATGAVLPYTSVDGRYVINLDLPVLAFRRLYNIVLTNTVSDPIPAKLKPLLGSVAQNGAICKYGSGLLSDYGFIPLPASLCGAVS